MAIWDPSASSYAVVLNHVSDAFHPGSLSNYMEQNPLPICIGHLAWVENEPLFPFCRLTPPLLTNGVLNLSIKSY